MEEKTSTGAASKGSIPRLFRFAAVKKLLLHVPELTEPHSIKQSLAQFILVRVILLTILLGTTSWQLLYHGAGKRLDLAFIAIGLTYAVSIANAFWLKSLRSVRQFAYFQLSIDILLATFAIYITNSTVSISLYLLVIVAASLLLGSQGALVMAAVAGISYAVLTAGLLPLAQEQKMAVTSQEVLIIYISLVSVALVSSYLARQLAALARIASENQRSLDHLSKQQEQVLNDVSDGVITLSLESMITGINEAACSIIGLRNLSPDMLVGRRLPDLLRENKISGLEKVLDALDCTETPKQITITNGRKQQDIHLNYSIKPLADNGGAETGRVLILDDVSREKTIQEQLDLHERMTKLLSETSVDSNRTSLSPNDVRMVGESQIMRKVFALVERVAASDASVLITGESGTGKELIAKAIHATSRRKNAPFVAVNCSAIPETLIESELFGHKRGSFTGAVSDNIGLFRQAQHGTIFLDEIGELPLHLQTKLLRVLQDRMVRAVGDTRDTPLDVRVIAATNRELKKEIAAAKFREDLYYRLNVVNILVPPLRERKEDIPLLVHYFIARFCDKDETLPHISPEALQLLTSFHFPGNVRELENIIERMLVLGGKAILPEHLPEEVLATGNRNQLYSRTAPDESEETKVILLPIDLESALSALEKRYLHMALEEAGGIKKEAAKLLGLNFRSLRYRLKKYGLGEPGSEREEESRLEE